MMKARLRSLLALGGTLFAVTALAGTAASLPPGGASPDSAGTSGSASPQQLRAGETISFRIKGFPPGEVVSVKVDDGDFCSAQGVHGACVVHQQKSSKDGSMSGSFVLPADLPAGKHWLRFLASEEMTDAQGNYVGVKPYSLRGDTGFTVMAEAAQSAAPQRSDPASRAGRSTQGSAPQSDGSTVAEPRASGAGGAGTGSSAPSAGAGEAGSPAGAAEAEVPLVIPALVTERPSDAEVGVVAAQPEAAEAAPVPWIGASVLAACLIGVGAVFGAALVRNTRAARSA